TVQSADVSASESDHPATIDHAFASVKAISRIRIRKNRPEARRFLQPNWQSYINLTAPNWCYLIFLATARWPALFARAVVCHVPRLPEASPHTPDASTIRAHCCLIRLPAAPYQWMLRLEPLA